MVDLLEAFKSPRIMPYFSKEAKEFLGAVGLLKSILIFIENWHQFRVLKKWCDRLCWGPGARTERAGSIGRSVCILATEIKACFRPRRRGISSPPHPRRNQRLMIPIPPLAGPRALEALGPYDALFFKELKCYEN
jgi:hypothetical protein